MSQKTLSKTLFFVGFTSLLHAAYSAAQHRSYLRLTEEEFTSLPADILVQGILALFVTMYGVINIAGDFKEIRANVELETMSWETFGNLSSFYVFNHRGKALSTHYVPPPMKSHLEEISSGDS